MKLTDILPLETWKSLEEEIFERSGLQSSVYDVEGVRITDTKRWANRLCPVIKGDKRGLSSICAMANMDMSSEARTTGKPVIGECDAGMVKVVVPIFHQDEFLGTAGGCGLLLDEGEIDGFMVQKTIDLPQGEAESLSGGITQVSTSQMTELAAFIEGWLQQRLSGRK